MLVALSKTLAYLSIELMVRVHVLTLASYGPHIIPTARDVQNATPEGDGPDLLLLTNTLISPAFSLAKKAVVFLRWRAPSAADDSSIRTHGSVVVRWGVSLIREKLVPYGFPVRPSTAQSKRHSRLKFDQRPYNGSYVLLPTRPLPA